MVKTIDVCKSFGSLQVLRGVSLDVYPSEIVAVVGASGAGKTTLLQILGTLSKADSGSLFLDGVELQSLGEKRLSELRNRKIGFVFQFHHLLAEFDAVENVALPGYIAGRDRAEVNARAVELLNAVGMGHRLTHKPAELSGGEQQRVAIARALINSPAVVLADEPSGNLDSVTKAEIHKLFFDLRDKFGQTFIIVTHDEGLAALADRKIVMKDGQIVSE
ncbi:MAG: ABC transporter ATP-binding protein [Rikenellaceae bacterium]|nr:ABC transporter ATP-binding protein [Rikenellaceae bacterium]MBO7168569.1 ABC transporter ATP-binding protein [Rikenellaceae bacterium]